MASTFVLAFLILAIGGVGAACALAKRVGLVVPFAFTVAYVFAVGAITFINIGVFDLVDPKFRQAWVRSWLEVYWPLWTVLFTPSAGSALLACWFSRPSTRTEATALLGMYLFLIIAGIEAPWALDPYVRERGFWFLVGEFALLSMIFFAAAYVRRVAKGEQHGLSALRGNSGP